MLRLESLQQLCRQEPFGLHAKWKNFNKENTVMIRIPDQSGIQMVDLCPVIEWSGFQKAKSRWLPFKNQEICPVF
jgi:hypothetical protein